MTVYGMIFFIVAVLGTAGSADANGGDSMFRTSVTGYIQVQYMYDLAESASPSNSFELRRARAKLNSDVTNNVRAVIEVDCGQGAVTVKDAGVEWKARRWLEFFLGQHKMPFSREQLRSASRLLVIDRGEANDAFDEFGYLGRDIGASAHGAFTSGRAPIGYALGVFNGNGTEVRRDNDNNKQLAERITAGPVGDLSIGLNSAQHWDSITGDPMLAYGIDLSFQKWGMTLEAEALAGNTDIEENMIGGYLAGLYRHGRAEGGFKAERFYPDSDETDVFLDTYTLNLGYYLSPRLRLRTDFVTSAPHDQDTYHQAVAQLQLEF